MDNEGQAFAADLLKAADSVVHDHLPQLPKPLRKDIHFLASVMTQAAQAHPGDDPESQQQRRIALMDCMGDLFSTTPGRWLANIGVVGIREGMVVALTTLMRDALAFEIGKAKALGNEQALLGGVAIAAIVLGPALNLIGGLKSIPEGTGNARSCISRVAMGLGSLGVILACHQTGVLEPFASTVTSLAAYNFARDACNFFFPLRDNTRSLPMPSVLAGGATYGLFQWLGSLAMGHATPRAGAGALPGAIFNGTLPLEQLAASSLDIAHSVGHAGLNALLEIQDGLVLPAIVKHMENSTYRAANASHLADEEAHRHAIRELGAFAALLLGVEGKDRQALIDEKNAELYASEVKRLEGQPELDLNQRDYLTQLKDTLARQAMLQGLGLLEMPELPPISVLLSDRSSTPDFTVLDQQIERELTRLGVSRDARARIVNELYVYEFQRAYVPLLRTPVEESVLQRLKEEARTEPMLPSDMMDSLLYQVNEERRAATVGLSISIGFGPRMPDPLQRLSRQLFITNAMRQSAFLFAVGVLYATSGVLENLDDDTRAIVEPLILGVAISLAYVPLLMAHLEGAPGRLPSRPNGEGGLPPLTQPREAPRQIHAGSSDGISGDELKSFVD
ncbi:hypothetical protein [Variovorax sp. KK3]|uniref:hypothetical protein n=1 Tax=Variovorax sp. KK3 TaxID=1855728 RepID=UPI00117CB2EF|nr:hypothetical protein [Variovorax sp. KK3]